jgi:hypothetical protein
MRLAAIKALSVALAATAGPAAAGSLDRFLEATTPVREAAQPEPEASAERLIERSSRFAPGEGEIDFDWSSDRVVLGRATGRAVNSLEFSQGRSLRTPGGAPLSLDRAVYETDTYEVALRRDWSLVRFDAGKYDVAFSPHAGFGWSSQDGALAEAGASLEVSQRRDDEVREALNELGVRDGADFGDQGRWYMFAAASGRAVGLNLMRDTGSWDQAGLSTDSASALIGDAHVGVGWRKGPVQTSLGYVHREVKGQNMIWGQETKADSLLAFSFTFRPQE